VKKGRLPTGAGTPILNQRWASSRSAEFPEQPAPIVSPALPNPRFPYTVQADIDGLAQPDPVPVAPKQTPRGRPMGKKTKHTFAKRQKELKRLKKAQEKREKRLARKQQGEHSEEIGMDSAEDPAAPEPPLDAPPEDPSSPATDE
jgi:hypothetical protein